MTLPCKMARRDSEKPVDSFSTVGRWGWIGERRNAPGASAESWKGIGHRRPGRQSRQWYRSRKEQRAGEYRLAWQRCDLAGNLPTKNFMRSHERDRTVSSEVQKKGNSAGTVSAGRPSAA